MKSNPEPSTQEVLALVERVTFHNAENGFCVLRAKARGHRDRLTATVGLSCFTAGQLAVPHAIVKGGSAPRVVAKVAHARA